MTSNTALVLTCIKDMDDPFDCPLVTNELSRQEIHQSVSYLRALGRISFEKDGDDTLYTITLDGWRALYENDIDDLQEHIDVLEHFVMSVRDNPNDLERQTKAELLCPKDDPI